SGAGSGTRGCAAIRSRTAKEGSKRVGGSTCTGAVTSSRRHAKEVRERGVGVTRERRVSLSTRCTARCCAGRPRSSWGGTKQQRKGVATALCKWACGGEASWGLGLLLLLLSLRLRSSVC